MYYLHLLINILGQERQHEDVEAALALGDVAPARQHAERHERRGEQHHDQRDAVEPDPVADPPGGNPRIVGD